MQCKESPIQACHSSSSTKLSLLRNLCKPLAAQYTETFIPFSSHATFIPSSSHQPHPPASLKTHKRQLASSLICSALNSLSRGHHSDTLTYHQSDRHIHAHKRPVGGRVATRVSLLSPTVTTTSAASAARPCHATQFSQCPLACSSCCTVSN